jgi:hypothetical protein
MSQDHVIAAAASLDKQRKAKASAKKGEKAGLHVDVIDRLDYSSVGPASTYPEPLIYPLQLTATPSHLTCTFPLFPFALVVPMLMNTSVPP